MKQKIIKENQFKPDIDMLAHKYSDYYKDFVIYDAREIVYPVYKTKIEYIISKEQELHPIVIGILKIIDYLQKIKADDKYKILKNITQMDNEILASILGEFNIKGYLKVDSIELSHKGLEVLKKENEKIKERTISYVAIDGVLGTILEIAKDQKQILLDHKSHEGAFEFKPNFKTRPRTENLDVMFMGDKTLRQTLIESLKDFDKQEEKDNKNLNYEINDILSIEPKKFFKKYYCLFYKNQDEEEKILVIDKNYNEDINSTKFFDRLLSEQRFSDSINQKAKEYEENAEKFQDLTSEKIEEKLAVNLEEGKTIETAEHKKYLKYILKNAQKEIYIQSPWIRYEILNIYKDKIDEALKRGVKIIIKYGLKPKNRFDKAGIDDKSQEYFNGLDKKLFKLKQGNDHSKILICDDKFMIVGSFNWLSFGGEKDRDGDTRGETSTINKNKSEIVKTKEKFI